MSKSIRKFVELFKKPYETLNLIEIDRRNLLHNLNFFRGKTGLNIWPVLKSNAYGHGLKQVAQIIDGQADFVAVDGYFEADQIFQTASHLKILCMSYIKPKNFRNINTRRVSFVIQTADDLRAVANVTHRKINVHLELNTGMNRMGLRFDEIDDYLRELKRHKNLKLEGVMTHLADADNPNQEFTDRQIKEFDRGVAKVLAAGFKPKYFHIAASAGALKVHSKYANAIRLGLCLYGINPLAEKDLMFGELDKNLRPVLELKSTIIKIIDLEKGDKVSYSCTFTVPRSIRVGVLPLGYYEALPRDELSNHQPIVGRICMNHTIIDITDKNLVVGDQVVVISKNPADFNSIAMLEKTAGLFPYEFLCKITDHIHREIV